MHKVRGISLRHVVVNGGEKPVQFILLPFLEFLTNLLV